MTFDNKQVKSYLKSKHNRYLCINFQDSWIRRILEGEHTDISKLGLIVEVEGTKASCIQIIVLGIPTQTGHLWQCHNIIL